MPNPLTIALTAPGMMGAGIGARLHAHGCRVIVPLDERSQASLDRARKAGMEHAEWEELGQADMILSVVSPEHAEGTAERVAQANPGARTIYVDLNAITPARALRIQKIAEGAGMGFTDGGIIGPPPSDKGDPVLYLSGPAAADAAGLRAYGLRTEVLHGPVGEASALKLSYAGITKGLAALGATMMLAAARAGVEEQLMAELGVSQSSLAQGFAKSIPGMLPKSGRWVSEMHEIADFIGEEFPEHGIYRGIAGLYERLYDAHLADGEEAEILRDLVGR